MRIRSAAWFPPGLVISTDASLVELAATVRDRNGHLVGGLRASDFEVLDNKQPREITFFSEQIQATGRRRCSRQRVHAVRAPAAAPPPNRDPSPCFSMTGTLPCSACISRPKRPRGW